MTFTNVNNCYAVKDKKVRKSLGDGNEDYQALIESIMDANNLAVFTLNENGYIGTPFEGKVEMRERTKLVTKAHTLERQLFLLKASTAGKKFIAAASHLTAIDVFVGTEY